MKFKKVLNELQDHKIPVPGAAESDELADWIADLIEFDGHVVGIATTALAQGYTHKYTLKQKVKDLLTRLKNIKDVTPEDDNVYRECKDYMKILEKVIEQLQYIPVNPKK